MSEYYDREVLDLWLFIFWYYFSYELLLLIVIFSGDIECQFTEITLSHVKKLKNNFFQFLNTRLLMSNENFLKQHKKEK